MCMWKRCLLYLVSIHMKNLLITLEKLTKPVVFWSYSHYWMLKTDTSCDIHKLQCTIIDLFIYYNEATCIYMYI